MRTARRRTLALSMALGASALVAAARPAAAQTSIPVGAFPGSALLLDFNGQTDGDEVNGVIVGGVLFSYSLGNGHVIFDGGPGVTNNVSPLNIVSIGDNSGILSLTLPGSFTMFGYGFAVLNTGVVPNATTITLFNGATNLGSLSYDGAPDPLFTGGFAGIQSATAFDRIEVTFDAVTSSAFAMDNVLLAGATTTTPEPATIALVATGLIAVGLRARRRRV